MTRFIVIRHGETEWNVAARIQGQGDSTLTAAGRAQAEAIARRVAGENVEALVSSDLGRAIDTARALARITGLAIVPDARLRERHFGRGEGMTYEEIGRLYPGAFTRDVEVDPDYAIPGGESRRQFHDRVVAAFEALAREHAGRVVAVVTHGGVLATLYRHMHGIALSAPHRVAITNASYNALTHDGEAFAVDAWDDVDHLGGETGFEET